MSINILSIVYVSENTNVINPYNIDQAKDTKDEGGSIHSGHVGYPLIRSLEPTLINIRFTAWL